MSSAALTLSTVRVTRIERLALVVALRIEAAVERRVGLRANRIDVLRESVRECAVAARVDAQALGALGVLPR